MRHSYEALGNHFGIKQMNEFLKRNFLVQILLRNARTLLRGEICFARPPGKGTFLEGEILR